MEQTLVPQLHREMASLVFTRRASGKAGPSLRMSAVETGIWEWGDFRPQQGGKKRRGLQRREDRCPQTET